MADGGTAASAEIELDRATDWPPLGAGELSVTVPVEVAPLPPLMLDGFRVSEITVGPESGSEDELGQAVARFVCMVPSAAQTRPSPAFQVAKMIRQPRPK